MIEIFAIKRLVQWIEAALRQRSYPAAWFKGLGIGLWLGGELGGAFLAVWANPREGLPWWLIYLAALAGAALGAAVALGIAHHPESGYRWWRAAACLLGSFVFFIAGTTDTGLPGAPLLTALSFFFIAVMLGTILLQDILQKRKAQSVFLGIGLVCWLVLALGYAVLGGAFVNFYPWATTLGMIAAALTFAITIWCVVDAVLNHHSLA